MTNVSDKLSGKTQASQELLSPLISDNRNAQK